MNASPGDSLPSELAQRQLDAYNARDIDAFVACYHPDVEVRDFPSGKVTLEGRAAMRERYGPMFAKHPELHAKVTQRVALGAVVIDEERVTGVTEGVISAVALYEVEGDSIRRVWFVRPR